jgi:hypothetical protein
MYEIMKAIVIHGHGGPEVLRYEDYPDPVPGVGEVLVINDLVVAFRRFEAKTLGSR